MHSYFRAMKKLFGLLVFLFFLSNNGICQRSVKDSTLAFVSLGANLGLQTPFADLSDRFGYGGLVGGELMLKTKSNLTFEGQYGFFFGNKVKEDTILKPLLTSQNFLINREGEPADVFLNERGFLINGKVGKIFPVIGPNPNSGLHLAVGAGFMQHKIRILEQSQKVPQLLGEYIKGYDRLTNGFMLSQSVGYSHFSNYKLVNYYIGFEIHEAFTQNRRSLNYDTGIKDDHNRLDIMGSILLRWYFPMYKRQPQEFYFY